LSGSARTFEPSPALVATLGLAAAVVAVAAVALATPAASAGPAGRGQLSGVLGGDGELEGGCAWLDASRGRYEVLWPPGYTVAYEPVRLIGPDGTVVARDGEQVTVRGREAPEAVTLCQVGPVWDADAVLP